MTQVKPTHERMALSFSVDGLSAREELLLKSFIRILSHRTLQSWTYSPLPYGDLQGLKADVEFISEDKLPNTVRNESIAHKAILVLGHVNRGQRGFLCLPINANELERELNQLGTQLVLARDSITSPSQSHQQNINTVSGSRAQEVRLIRWPPIHLLGSPVRIKLATLMAGRTITLTTLQQRSGQSEQICRDFLLDLQQVGLLSSMRSTSEQLLPPMPKHKSAPPVQLSLLARIRNRLGLQASANA